MRNHEPRAKALGNYVHVLMSGLVHIMCQYFTHLLSYNYIHLHYVDVSAAQVSIMNVSYTHTCTMYELRFVYSYVYNV